MAKVFISSVIAGMERDRDAVEAAARSLGHEIVRSERMSASSGTPQQACLAGVRESEIVVLLLGPRYGAPQASGLSATHEEYREARESKDVLAFVLDGAEFEPEQRAFVDEVQSWGGGLLTQRFHGPEDLRDTVTRALHLLAVSRALGAADPDEMRARAEGLVARDMNTSGARLVIALAGGPRQQVVRPATIESQELFDDLLRDASFGEARVLRSRDGTERRLGGPGLHLEQRHGSVYLDEEGSIRVVTPISDPEGSTFAALPQVIHEDVETGIERAIRYANSVLERIDPTQRLSRVAVVAAVVGADYFGWRSRDEAAKSPNSIEMRVGVELGPASLSPPDCARGALRLAAKQIAEDLAVRLRRGG